MLDGPGDLDKGNVWVALDCQPAKSVCVSWHPLVARRVVPHPTSARRDGGAHLGDAPGEAGEGAHGSGAWNPHRRKSLGESLEISAQIF